MRGYMDASPKPSETIQHPRLCQSRHVSSRQQLLRVSQLEAFRARTAGDLEQ